MPKKPVKSKKKFRDLDVRVKEVHYVLQQYDENVIRAAIIDLIFALALRESVPPFEITENITAGIRRKFDREEWYSEVQPFLLGQLDFSM